MDLEVGQTLVPKAQQLFDDKGRRLIKVETFVESGQRKWVGIAQDGNWASRFVSPRSLSEFDTKVQQLFDEDSLRLIDVKIFEEF